MSRAMPTTIGMCRSAREIFDVDAASLWQVDETSSAWLMARWPEAVSMAGRVPFAQLFAGLPTEGGLGTPSTCGPSTRST